MKTICNDCWKSESCYKKTTGKVCKRIPAKPKKIDRLSHWEWITLVASWRYYEYRCTITSATFPDDIIERYWASGEYDDAVLDMIAHQFASVDHGPGKDGEKDWIRLAEKNLIHDCDARPWCKFFAFLHAWHNKDFKTVVLEWKDDKGSCIYEEVEAFYCEYTKRWYEKNRYIEYPHCEVWCTEEFIKEVK